VSLPRAFHPLPVAEVIAETADACSLVFEVPPELSWAFDYRPGQFLTIRVPGRDGPVARCYSLSSSPHTGDRPTITVKRAGYASNWVADNVRAGTVLDVLPPGGTFTPRDLSGDLLMFAAGSGITPVMSIVKSVLAQGYGQVTLIYANRDDRSVIFNDTLRQLSASAGSRLIVLHWLDSLQGPPTAAALAALARPWSTREVYLCGPDPYLEVARRALHRLGVPGPRIHAERFLSLAGDPFVPAPPAPGGVAATCEVTLDGEQRTLAWPPGTRLLDLLLEAGLDAPFSCRQGVCGACTCQLDEGKVTHETNEVLDEADLAEGWILACQAVPRTGTVRVSYP
jgi:3-ketosteroid 9alpha-monooxygenase subunit B